MNDEYVNKGKVVALTSWCVVLGLMVVAWAVILLVPDHKAIGGMFAATGCAVSALAATFHIRCYAVRVMCLVRAASSLEPVGGGFDRPRPVRDR